MKYPKKIEKIIKEAPIAYGIVVLADYKSKKKTASKLFKEWQKDKHNL